jgi:hypothetical protein
MEKVIYSLWRQPNEERQTFALKARETIAPALLGLGVRGLQLNVRDSAIAAATDHDIEAARPGMDAIAHVWVDSAVHNYRKAVDELLQSHCSRIAGYLVTESQPLINNEFPSKPGERTPGLSQVVFMKRPPRLTAEAWMDLWHGDQTRLAVELQNNFSYAQNVIVRTLTHAAPVYDAVVEECLYEEALTDDRYRFRGATFEERERNCIAFIENTAKMVDFDKIDVMTTSQYVFKRPGV